MSIDLSNTTYSDDLPRESEESAAEFTPYIDPAEAAERAANALRLIYQYGQIDGAHHKTWTIDQITRILAGGHYDDFIEAYDVDDFKTAGYGFGWDEGVAP